MVTLPRRVKVKITPHTTFKHGQNGPIKEGETLQDIIYRENNDLNISWDQN